MSYDIRNIQNINHLIMYFSKVLNWDIDTDSFDDIDDISYDFSASDLGLKEEAFAKIKSIKQLPPMVDGQKWGIFCIEFDSKRFEVTALRKVLSGLVPSRRNSADHAVWSKEDLLFLCFWGEDNNRTIGIAHFEDKQDGLPQIKMTYCAPAIEDTIHIQDFVIKIGNLTWPIEVYNFQKWHDDWSKAFTTSYKQVIRDSQTLTMQLAKEAIGIRDRILETLRIETEAGYVHQLYNKFKETLIHDMSEKDFADMYAQTVVYGLFSARCMDETQEDFSAAEAVECIPNTNPFLKSLMKECLGSKSNSKLSFDELEIGNVVDLLMHTNTEEIIKDFNRQTGGGKEDPVIHFYEEFLTAYDKTQKVQRGVYYTPQPVVNYMVRAVDSIIKDEFGLEDGLGSTETKRIKYKRQSKYLVDGYHYKEVEDVKEVPAIQILDPATGTGTFIRQIILQIYGNFKAKYSGLSTEELMHEWNQYVPDHLLPRLNAFELMMAPYAVAHMKLAMVLRDTGYEFGNNKRLQVYLTNSLEEPGGSDKQISIFDDPLASESIAANSAKKNQGINVVIGNPPYAGESCNKGKWILDLIDDYKKEPGGKERLNERNPKWLNDDYVKFIRLAQLYVERANNGILAYICPHGFIDNPTFRGMRWQLASLYESIYVLDLHGNAKKRETAPDGSKDENVFDIQQGVCIVIMIHKKAKDNSLAKVFHADVYGTREDKYAFLSEVSFQDIKWKSVAYKEPFYLFKPSDEIKTNNEYFNVSELFINAKMGFQTHRDSFAIAYDKQTMIDRIADVCNLDISDSQLVSMYDFGGAWNVAKARKELRSMNEKEIQQKVVKCQYRIMDQRWCFLDGAVMDRPREDVFCHALNKDNIVFGVGRQGLAVGDIEWCLATVSHYPIDANIFRRGGITAAPLYLYKSELGIEKRTPNLNSVIVNAISHRINLPFSPEIKEGCFSPIDIVDYVYAILYSHKYRTTFADVLKIDFPQIPYPQSKTYFYMLVEKGKELRDIHTMDVKLPTEAICCSNSDDTCVSKLECKNGNIFINKSFCFKVTSDKPLTEIWSYTIGGNQVLQKWLKDRKGQSLSVAEIAHYKNMIAAIIRTIEIMDEIDEIIEL